MLHFLFESETIECFVRLRRVQDAWRSHSTLCLAPKLLLNICWSFSLSILCAYVASLLCFFFSSFHAKHNSHSSPRHFTLHLHVTLFEPWANVKNVKVFQLKFLFIERVRFSAPNERYIFVDSALRSRQVRWIFSLERVGKVKNVYRNESEKENSMWHISSGSSMEN